MLASIPYNPQAGDPEDISQIMADFGAILFVLNGNLDETNVGAGLVYSPAKIKGGGAVPGHAMIWNGSNWAPQMIFNRNVGATPPGSPSTGDIWKFPADATNGVNWYFVYNAGSASTFKWEFMGAGLGARRPPSSGSSRRAPNRSSPSSARRPRLGT